VTTAAEQRSAHPPLEAPRSRGYWFSVGRRILRQPAALFALAVLVALFTVGGLAHEIAPQGWDDINLASRWSNHAPTVVGHHYLGTDNIGRDVLVRTLWGLHDTESVALIGAAIATALGLLVGGLAGFRRGWLDPVLMRFVDLVTTFPVIVLMLVVFTLLEPVTATTATIVFALYMWTFVARVVRAPMLVLGAAEFVEAARAVGASELRIFFRHLLPNAAGTLVVAATSMVGQIMLVEATVEFFGFGVNSLLRPTLGNLTAEAAVSGIGHYNSLGLGWWVWATPAAVLVLVLLCVNVAGDGLDAALNPRTSR
jgi:peptide/nickel transport system permease protein